MNSWIHTGLPRTAGKTFPKNSLMKVPALSVAILYFLFFFISIGQLSAQIALRGTATSATSTSASVTVNRPTGVVSGDIMIANIGNYLDNTQTSASLSGWTLIAGTDLSRGRATLLYKIAGAGEPASYTFAVTSSSSAATGSIVAFSGVSNTNPFDVTNPSSWTTTSNQVISSIPSITTVTSNAAVVVFGNCSRITSLASTNFTSWTITSPSPLTEIMDAGRDGNTGNTVAVGAAWAIQSTPGATGSAGFTCTPNTNPRTMGGIMIALRPCVTANAGSALSAICKGGTSAALGGSTGGSATGGTWSDGGAGGSFSSSNISTATYTPAASYTGTVTLTLTTTGASCGTATSSKTLVVSDVPTSVVASASSNNVCGTTTFSLTGSASGATAGTVAFQGFESSGSTVTYTTTGDGATKSGTSGTGDAPASASFVNTGTGSYWLNNGTATITTANITGLSGFSAKKISLTLASFSIGSNSNGADGSDVVTVAISLNGGSSYSDELSVSGNNNAYWSFASGTGVASATYDGLNNAVAFAPAGSGARTTDGYELLEINLPDTCSQVRVRITMVNSSGNEAWVVDDITLRGTQMRYSWTSNPAGFTSGFQNPTGVSASATTIYTMTATSAGGCSATDTALVTINPLPSAPTGTAGSRCGTGTVSISATAGSGETIDWYAAASGGSVLSGGTGVTSFTTPSISATTNYFAQARNTTTGCLSGSRTSVAATINPTPTISNQSSSSAYGTATTYTITATNAATFSATGLPTGITLNTATGVLTIAADCPVGVYSISVSVTSSAGCNGAAAATVTYTRTAKALTITGATTTNKEYDGNTSASVTGGTLVGVVGSDVVTLTQAGTFANKTVGTNKAITSTCSISGTDAAKYTLTQPTLTARNITAKPLTVTGAVASNKIYNGNTAATLTGGTLEGVISPDVVNLTQAGIFADKNVGTGIAVTGNCSLSGTDAANYSITQPTGLSADITTAALTVTASNQVKCYGFNFSLGTTSFTTSGLGSGDAIASVTLNSDGADLFADPGTYAIIPSDATGASFSAANYNITYVNGTLTVSDIPSFSVDPSTDAQTLCQNGTATALSVSASPGSGTISSYQWYRNTVASSFGGTLISGATAATYTPSSATAGVFYYYCVVTNSFGCSLPSNVSGATTINALPTIVTVTGGGPVCNNTQLNASNGASGTIYYQGFTLNGTSTATPSTSQLISVTGTYYFRALSAEGCWGPQGSAAVVIQAPIVTGVEICQGATAGSMSTSSTCDTLNNQTSGPRDATTGANVTGVGTAAWPNPGNISTAGTPYAGGTGVNNGATTNYLRATNYGFNIPSNAAINGITLVINRSSSGTTSPFLQDNEVKLVRGGVIQSINKAKTGVNWTNDNVFGTATYGGTTDLWGINNWTPAEINATNFGAVLSAVNASTANSRTPNVDYMRITITYSIPGVLSWFTQTSGGSSIGTGSIFNPVGVSGSGISNTNTAGTIAYYVECSRNPGCRGTANYVINALPAAPTAGNAARCGTGTVDVSATPGSGETIDWYAASSGGTALLSSSTSYTTPSISATTVYHAQARNTTTGCVSSSRTAVTATVKSATTSSTSVTACIEYSWNGNTYTNSGTYSYLTTNAAGCDSTATLNLTITPMAAMPTLACYETANFNTTSCSWVVSGTQPAAPTGLACYETATFNNTTCSWDVSGTQPSAPTGLACYETANFNTTSCSWVVSGTQPAAPTGLACYETATFNNTTCSWDVTGSEPAPIITPVTACDSYTWSANGQTYTASGSYTVVANCQTNIIDLTITASTSNTTVESACSQYTWSVNGQTYTSSGAYTSVTNCAAEILNLTIKLPVTKDTTVTACGSYAINGSTYTTSGDYFQNFTAANGCDSILALHVTINAWPTNPGVVAGITEVCSVVGSSTPTIYSISPVTGVASYAWTVPNGATIVNGQGTNSIGVTFTNTLASTNQVIRVFTISAEGCQSLASSMIVLTKTIPGIPASISGPSNACPFVGAGTASYTCDAVANATSYSWTVPNGATIVSGQGTRTIEVSYSSSFTNGSITVAALSNCGNRSARSFPVNRLTPTAPVAISGPTSACLYLGNGQQVTYSVAPVANASSYTWTVPSTVTIVSGQGSNSIVVTFAGNYVTSVLKVRSVSNCFSSGDRQLQVTAATYAGPGSISGPTNACYYVNNDASATYRIRKVANVPSYIWTVPAGVEVLEHPGGSGANDTSIVVSFNSNFVFGSQILVQTAGCGASAPRVLTITGTLVGMAGLISGPTNVCEFMESSSNPNGNIATYKIPKSPAATFYTWRAPSNSEIISHPGGTGENDTIVLVKFEDEFTTGSIKVKSGNSCGSSVERSLSLTRLNPSTPSSFDVVQVSDCPSRVYTYSLASMPANATSIAWTVPEGATIVSGQGTRVLTVSYPPSVSFGFVTAQGINNCASSSIRTRLIKIQACPSAFTTTAPTSKGVADATDEMTVSVYPNPTTTEFRINLNSRSSEVVKVRVMDMQGRMVKGYTLAASQQMIFGNDLKAGSYMVEFIQGNKLKTTRVVKY